MAQDIAKVTHSHAHGVMGGVMQAVGVYHALRGATPAEVRERVEATVEDDIDYSMKMGIIHRSLDKSEDDLDYIVQGGDEAAGLGNGVAALESVPTALFCFLKVLGREETGMEKSIEASQALFEEVLVLAIRCGGDTDTIASMACALAGAALGQTIEPVNRFFTAENTEAQPDLECLVGLDSATVSEVYKVLSNSSHTVSIIYWGSGLTFFTRCGATRRGTSVSNITARLPTVSTERTTSLNTTADSEPSSL